MKIKRKLFLMVFGEMLMFLVVLGVVIVSVLPIIKINEEFRQLNTLSNQVLKTEVELALLLTSAFEMQWEKAKDSRVKLAEQFDIVEAETRLSGINLKVEKAMKTIITLEELFDANWVKLENSIPAMLANVKRVLFTTASPLTSLYKSEMVYRFDDAGEILKGLSDLESLLTICDGTLSTAYNVIQQQDELIQNEISKKVRRLIIIVSAIFIIVVLIVIIVSTRIASLLAGSVVSLEEGVNGLRDGDLTVEFSAVTKDEIGRFGANLNYFTRELSDSIKRIKESSANTLKMKDELSSAAGDSKTSSEAINSAVGGIRDGMIDLDSKVAGSGEAVEIVRSRTDELKGMLDEQMAMIEESTSSVTEMIASINNVSDITGRKKAATDQLVKSAAAGGEKLDETINVIQKITGSIDEIRGTASIIQAVAAQTSLLAMNAAIEAAHAGEYGAGFAVVAEEIRKLADASSVSSKRIGGVLKDVIASIELAASYGDDTRRSFVEIDSEVCGVASALDEITSSMNELSAGGKQILDAMTSLQGYAVDVKDSGNAMGDASTSLSDAFTLVERVTSRVLENIGGITSSIDEIRGAVGLVADISSRLSQESERLDAEVASYCIEDEEWCADTGEAADAGEAAAEESDAAEETELLTAAVVDESADQSG